MQHKAKRKGGPRATPAKMLFWIWVPQLVDRDWSSDRAHRNDPHKSHTMWNG
jgi:hypothetical protein